MRGSTLFNDLFTNEMVTVRQKTAGKGRSVELDIKRNKLLLLRYVYYGKHTTDRYEIILNNLENEFHISQRRIQDIIQENSTTLRQHRNDFPAIPVLRKMYPHLVW